VAVNHQKYRSFTEADFLALSEPNGILFDVKGIYRGQIKELCYMSL
jgi:UDP-N-acetyl-D-galactosamine dehydrogenase